ELVAEGVPAERIRVVPPGRDPAPPPPERSDLRRGRQLALLCVANWIPRKGTLELLEAVARLPPAVATLHLAGDDRADPPYAARVRARLGRADLAGRVVVHGPVSRERVAGLYRDADVFVLPSVREPYGTVYGEAMAAGLPVVGWRAGNLPHLADHEVEGLLIEPGDVEALARAIRRLAVEGQLRRRLAAAARARGRSRPTWEGSVRAFLEHVRQVVGSPGRGTIRRPA
ncbi:MAG TPA: glycosyltransferase family 4 protein, partial [Actinomycetota bacterium]|nr:glycosyltransferase family 4 protein [Actinomycetota bacterium]